MNGDILGSFGCLVELLQGSFCKYLIQNSQSDDTGVLTLTLRVIFNLFQSLKSFLKVQLEVFFNSVHIRLADTSPPLAELTSSAPVTLHDFLPKEASLESLLDFCQEPTVMIDLYTNVRARASFSLVRLRHPVHQPLRAALRMSLPERPAAGQEDAHVHPHARRPGSAGCRLSLALSRRSSTRSPSGARRSRRTLSTPRAWTSRRATLL